jgi:hypothetical protein
VLAFRSCGPPVPYSLNSVFKSDEVVVPTPVQLKFVNYLTVLSPLYGNSNGTLVLVDSSITLRLSNLSI